MIQKLRGFFKRPIPMWAPFLVLLLAAVPPTLYGSLNVPSGGTITDTNQLASSCVGTNASGKYVYNSGACVSTTPSPTASTGLTITGTWPYTFSLIVPVTVANGGTNISSLVGTRCIRSATATSFGEAAGDCVTNVTASGNIASSGGTTPNITFTGTLPVANGGTNLASLAGSKCIRSASTTAMAEAAGDCVTNVTGSGNIASSGGTTPNITFTGVLPIANGGTATAAPSPSASTGCQVSGTWPANVYGCPNMPRVFASPTASPMANPHVEVGVFDAGNITCTVNTVCTLGTYTFRSAFASAAYCTGSVYGGSSVSGFVPEQNTTPASSTSSVGFSAYFLVGITAQDVQMIVHCVGS